MNKDINEVEFTLFDTETTGLSPVAGDRVVEIAGLRFKGDQVIDVFESFVQTGKEISPGAFAVNKITPQMLKNAPLPNEAIPNFVEFAKDSCLLSYNAIFDWDFLTNELSLIGMNLPQETEILDILKMARRAMPGLGRYPLWFVAQTLGVENPQEHRALADAKMSFKVFLKLKAMLKTKGVEDFSALLNLSRIQQRCNL
ncbi:MAG: 3'-5' exonuclease [Candidatus Omnitrophica bacterium]|jgi:DNA polymerase III epsilon subunit family exonuclease|nr:3'-5' exonuclease [Candidatus Omnitrophota bacterium]